MNGKPFLQKNSEPAPTNQISPASAMMFKPRSTMKTAGKSHQKKAISVPNAAQASSSSKNSDNKTATGSGDGGGACVTGKSQEGRLQLTPILFNVPQH